MEEALSTDLNIFQGLEGFEKFDPLDDSSLAAILDDLEEGTLLSMLGDETLVNGLADEIHGSTGKIETKDFAIADITSETRGQPQFKTFTPGDQTIVQTSTNLSTTNSPLEDLNDSVALLSKRPLTEAPPQTNPLKRARLDSVDGDYLLTCVHHDHSYASSQCVGGGRERVRVCKEQPGTPVASSSDEEGSLSDAGYDTMSSSTSPGTNTNSPPSSTGPVGGTKSPSLPTKLDPVALIDARIQHFVCGREVNLTEEEKETLKAEGLPIPTTLPLTKTEEKALRGVRRRIRNKVAAQESRKRKKEHLSQLEERCQQYSGENTQLKRKIDTLESENKTLKAEIIRLKQLLGSQGTTSKNTRVGACLMVIVLCFAVFFGSMTPHSLWSRPSDYTTSTVRSRSLLSMEDTTLQSLASNWFRETFMLQSSSVEEEPAHAISHHDNYPPLLHGPLSYYQHVYYHFSGYLNFSSVESSDNHQTNLNSTITKC